MLYKESAKAVINVLMFFKKLEVIDDLPKKVRFTIDALSKMDLHTWKAYKYFQMHHSFNGFNLLEELQQDEQNNTMR